jgi:hypothetical protein
LHFTKKAQMAMIKPQPIKSIAITFGENSNPEWVSPLAMGVMATKRLRQKTMPQTQIVIDFRFITFSRPLLLKSPPPPTLARDYATDGT